MDWCRTSRREESWNNGGIRISDRTERIPEVVGIAYGPPTNFLPLLFSGRAAGDTSPERYVVTRLLNHALEKTVLFPFCLI